MNPLRAVDMKHLPAGVRVPHGALDKSVRQLKSLLMRSTSAKPLSEQVASLVKMAQIIAKLSWPMFKESVAAFMVSDGSAGENICRDFIGRARRSEI